MMSGDLFIMAGSDHMVILKELKSSGGFLWQNL